MFPLSRLRAAVVAVSLPLSGLVPLVSNAAGAAAPAVRNASVGTQSRDLVFNGAALEPFVHAAETRRVDIVGIGDSNQVAGPGSNYGWDHGYPKAWTDRYGQYATGVFGTNARAGWAGPQGYINSWNYPYGAARTGAPAALDKYKLFYDSQNDNLSDFPSTYAYFGPDYVETQQNWTPLVTLRKASPLWGQDLRWHLTYGTFDSGAGEFTPSFTGQFGKLSAAPSVSTSTGSIGLADGAFDIPAAAYKNSAGAEMHGGLSFSGEGTMRGPFFGLWQRVEGDRESGVSYSTALWQGGRALVHAATALQAQSDDALQEYIRNTVKLQDGQKMLLVQVNHGGNDGGWSIPSVGPNPTESNTPAGFADNMEALITRLRGVWSAMGHDSDNLIFQYGPYHPIDGPALDGTGRSNVQRLADWESAIIALSQQHPEYNLAVLRGSKLTTPLTMKRNGWYTSATDHAHLSIDGYIGIPELAVRQAVAYATADEISNRSAVTSLSFEFDSDVSALLSPDDLELRDLGSNALMDPFDLAVDWDAATRTATWTFQGLPMGELPVGEYEAILLVSQLGGGADYAFQFAAAPIPEPATIGAAGVLMLALARRRRRS
jgi:hypothetical protein